MENFIKGQTVSIPRLSDMGKGFIYAIETRFGEQHAYIQFSESVGRRILPFSLLQAEAIPVKISKRYRDDEEGAEVEYIEDTPSLQDTFGEMPSYNN